MARNGPPVSVPGFGSQVSSWLTPPDEEDDHHPLAGLGEVGRRTDASQRPDTEDAKRPDRRGCQEATAAEVMIRRVAGVVAVLHASLSASIRA